MIDFILTHQSEIIQKTLQHISLSLSAVFIACLVGIPIGFLIVNKKKLSNIVINIANVIQTIPSLAMFAFALPVFGIGAKPAIFALFLYALLPILKNTLLGIKSVNPAVIQAGRGIGMSKRQIMFKVEIPLSISIIMGGIRIATVTSIGVTTIATLIAAGGLGDFIYRGLSTFNMPMILTGAVLSAILALIADFFLGLLEKKLTSEGLKDMTSKRKKPKNTQNIIIGIAIIIIAIMGYSLFKKSDSQTANSKEKITIVHKNYTEQRLLGATIGLYLDSIGYETEVKELGGTMLCFNAIKSGEADLYPEYTGTLYANMLNRKTILSAEETYDIVKKEIDEQFDIYAGSVLGFNDTYVISVTDETAKKYNLKTISDIEPYAGDMLLGGDSEFGTRELDGYPALQRKYGFGFKDYKSMDQGITYKALVDGIIDVNASYATDGRLKKYNLVSLVDDKNVFPPFTCFPIMKNEFAESHPDITKTLDNLKNVWDDKDMQKYNLMVDEGGDINEVARLMLTDKGLL